MFSAMHLPAPGFRSLLAACVLSAACSASSAFAVDPTPKQSEAIYSELARHPEFKAADDALNGSYRQRIKGADPASAGRVKEEQRQWLKAMQAAVFNAPPGDRLRQAIRNIRAFMQTGTNMAEPVGADAQ